MLLVLLGSRISGSPGSVLHQRARSCLVGEASEAERSLDLDAQCAARPLRHTTERIAAARAGDQGGRRVALGRQKLCNDDGLVSQASSLQMVTAAKTVLS